MSLQLIKIKSKHSHVKSASHAKSANVLNMSSTVAVCLRVCVCANPKFEPLGIYPVQWWVHHQANPKEACTLG
jgi:hypothetical protein